MELRHLKYFLAVADELNYSAAARTLHISQSALSRAVKELEEEIGVTLLNRTTTHVSVTPEGNRLIDLANDILDSIGNAVLEIRHMGDTHAKRIEVGYITPALDSFLHDTMNLTTQRHPDLDIHLHDLSPQQQIEKLTERKLDIALIGSTCKELMSAYDLFTLCNIPLCLVTTENHRLAKRKSIRLAECENEPFIGLREDTFPGRNHVIRSCCERAGFTPHLIATADTLNSLLAWVKAGRGITLVPADITPLLPRNVVLLPIRTPACSIEFSAAVAKDEQRPAIRLFLQECRDLAQRSVRNL
jgi:DNA-binding transcriptional LysR family regulator